MNRYFECNEHAFERVARVWFGLVLLGLMTTHTIGAWGWVGVVPLATGIVGHCPLYQVFGISTCPMHPGHKT